MLYRAIQFTCLGLAFSQVKITSQESTSSDEVFESPFSVDDLMESTLLNVFSTPEVNFNPQPVEEGSKHRLRRLQPLDDGTFPNIEHTGNFHGVTTKGFVSYSYSALVSNTSINLEQYSDILTAPGVGIECSVLGKAPRVEETGAVTRSAVNLTFTIPVEVASSHEDGISHMEARLVTGHVVIIGIHVMVHIPAFRRGGSCAGAIPATSPYYQIIIVASEVTALTTSFTYTMRPVDFPSIFAAHSIDFEWDPMAEREIERRRQLGLPLPAEEVLSRQLSGYHEARRLSIQFDADNGFNFNYDATTKKATTSKLNIIPNNILYCEDCYAYFNVKVHFKMSACLKARGLDTYMYWYDTTSPWVQNSNTAGYDVYWKGATLSEVPQGPPKDCVELDNEYKNDPNLFDIAVKAEARISGDVGINFKLKSDGVSARTTTCSSPTDMDFTKPSCRSNLLDKKKKYNPITLGIAGMPVSFTPYVGMQMAGAASVVVPGTFQAGAYLFASAEAGGSVHIKGTTATAIAASTANFDAKFFIDAGFHPFVLTGFNTFAGEIGARLYPTLTLSLYDVIPIYAESATDVKLAVALGGSRRANDYQEAALRGSDAHRALAVDSTCSSVGGSYSVVTKANALAGVTLVTMGDIISGATKGMDGESIVPSTFSSLATTTIIPAETSPLIETLPEIILASGCTNEASGPVASAAPTQIPSGYLPAQVLASFTISGLTMDIVSNKSDAVKAAFSKALASMLKTVDTKVTVNGFRDGARRLHGTATEGLERRLAGSIIADFSVEVPSSDDATAMAGVLDMAFSSAGKASYATYLNLAYKVAAAAGQAASGVSIVMPAAATGQAPMAPTPTTTPTPTRTPTSTASASRGAVVGGTGGTGSSSSSGTSTGAPPLDAIVGGVIGGLVGVALLIAAGVYFGSKMVPQEPKAVADTSDAAVVNPAHKGGIIIRTAESVSVQPDAIKSVMESTVENPGNIVIRAAESVSVQPDATKPVVESAAENPA